jgi:hypothetical protein
VKQKVKQNGSIGEAKTLDIHSGEAGEAKIQQIGQKNSQQKSNGHLTADQKLVAATIKAEMERLGWDAAILQDLCRDKYGKSGFVDLTEPEMLDLVLYMETWN